MNLYSKLIIVAILSVLLVHETVTALAQDPTEVPKLTGEKIHIAKQVAAVARLNPVVGTYFIASQNWRNDIRTDVVSMQTPQPGTLVTSGSHIGMWRFVKATEDKELIDVPDVQGKSSEEATEILTQLGLKPFGDLDHPESKTILDQFPVPGTKVFIGTSIFVTLRK